LVFLVLRLALLLSLLLPLLLLPAPLSMNAVIGLALSGCSGSFAPKASNRALTSFALLSPDEMPGMTVLFSSPAGDADTADPT
jgi:hypothetical protein